MLELQARQGDRGFQRRTPRYRPWARCQFAGETVGDQHHSAVRHRQMLAQAEHGEIGQVADGSVFVVQGEQGVRAILDRGGRGVAPARARAASAAVGRNSG
jgi:hypothetical protein